MIDAILECNTRFWNISYFSTRCTPPNTKLTVQVILRKVFEDFNTHSGNMTSLNSSNIYNTKTLLNKYGIQCRISVDPEVPV